MKCITHHFSPFPIALSLSSLLSLRDAPNITGQPLQCIDFTFADMCSVHPGPLPRVHFNCHYFLLLIGTFVVFVGEDGSINWRYQ